VFEKKVLRKIIGCKKAKVVEQFRVLHDKEVGGVCKSPSTGRGREMVDCKNVFVRHRCGVLSVQ
jgi:hypothetical protein